MHISIIAAMDRAGLIGDDKGLPWRLPKDLQWFKDATVGKPVIMGRKTFRLIGRPLPNRHNIVLSRTPGFTAPGCLVAHSVEESLTFAKDYLAAFRGDEVMVVGGGKVYAEFANLCDRIYLTIVDGQFQGTAYFPKGILRQPEWQLVLKEYFPADFKNPYAHYFFEIERPIRRTGSRSTNGTPGSSSRMDDLLSTVEF